MAGKRPHQKQHPLKMIIHFIGSRKSQSKLLHKFSPASTRSFISYNYRLSISSGIITVSGHQ